MGTRDVNEELARKVRELYPEGRVLVYLDDGYIWVRVDRAAEAVTAAEECFARVGLALQRSKVKAWVPSQTQMPEDWGGRQVDTFDCLGAHLRVMGDIDESPIRIGDQAHPFATPILRLQALAQGLADLCDHGLPKHVAGAMLRKYTGAAAQHVMRNNFMTDEEADSYDVAVLAAWTRILGKEVPDGPLLQLPGKFGGVGATCAKDRHNAAIWTAWQSALDDILEASGHNSAEDLLHKCPNLSDL